MFSLWCMGPHCTGLPLALPPDTGHSSPCSHRTSDMGPPPLSPATNMWWPSLETFSNLFTWGPPLSTGTDICDWSMYGWQADGTHPPGMLSCFNNRTNAKAIGFMKIQSSGIELNQIWDSRTNTIFLHKHHIFCFFENMLTKTKKKKFFHDDDAASLEETLELSVESWLRKLKLTR